MSLAPRAQRPIVEIVCLANVDQLHWHVGIRTAGGPLAIRETSPEIYAHQRLTVRCLQTTALVPRNPLGEYDRRRVDHGCRRSSRVIDALLDACVKIHSRYLFCLLSIFFLYVRLVIAA